MFEQEETNSNKKWSLKLKNMWNKKLWSHPAGPQNIRSANKRRQETKLEIKSLFPLLIVSRTFVPFFVCFWKNFSHFEVMNAGNLLDFKLNSISFYLQWNRWLHVCLMGFNGYLLVFCNIFRNNGLYVGK